MDYRILSGVRRAKAHELEGRATVTARIMRAGRTLSIEEVPVADLWSRKTELDHSDPIERYRLDRVRLSLRDGRTTDPIEVEAGTDRVRLCDVQIVY